MKKIKLFCIPYAGGSATVYSKWKRLVSANIEIVEVELTGRGRRINEALIDNMDDMIEDIYTSIKDQLQEPYAIFGHSMGGLITYELCQRLKKESHQDPVHIFISGRKAPHIKNPFYDYHDLPFDEFVKKIVNYGGMEREIFENKELAEIFVPILRADFKLIETYEYSQSNHRLDYDFSIFHGNNDHTVQWNDIIQWDEIISGNSKYHRIPGGHFFINENTRQVTDIVCNVLGNEINSLTKGMGPTFNV
ncbi:MAG: thioesterase II family protein [Bacillota bacterium]|uniref:Thioesterase n=1 Tax=Virgibacillus salarius TaxID=447199 RepID=A0A941DWB6_9BACI|nr:MULTISPECIES: thioesterase domain-containing protein [Bacillaceae]MBR7796319.1 thioesterase [Virgibacillus salarius]MDY7044801.1 thioesterase domain-containing protein [Virgibacillus sp. M23]NAZ09028.1 thioesterase [Agaribacter marinus]WBX80270.1 thioesterase domain-containing protein [Virgibacillus salarius]